MRLMLALAALVAASPALAQSDACRGQARTVEREIIIDQPNLSTNERFMAESRRSYAEGLCDTDPNRGNAELDKLRRELELSQRPTVIQPNRDRWDPGGFDRLD